jgi:hypothetical protein
LEITNLENDEAVLYGTIVDQAALHGRKCFLKRLRGSFLRSKTMCG